MSKTHRKYVASDWLGLIWGIIVLGYIGTKPGALGLGVIGLMVTFVVVVLPIGFIVNAVSHFPFDAAFTG
jgi:hypothetical protein